MKWLSAVFLVPFSHELKCFELSINVRTFVVFSSGVMPILSVKIGEVPLSICI